ncbi:MAG: response regulator [Spirochaetaceae bacterium]|nr:response regulator [Spirochaetaceae bacterium]
MHQAMDPNQELKTLRERISTLSSAILRISATLDVTTVLQEVVDSARTLTGARYGVITTNDEQGQLQEYVSSGFTAEEHAEFAAWPDGPKLWEHLRDLPGPIRLSDLPAFVRSLGYSPDLMRSKTFQGTPIRHRGMQVGQLFLAEKEGAPEFTTEDEKVLVMFASLAATAIANARTHRDEQRARADLEALVETSPMGVVVFNAGTGHPTWSNREARRIVESLRSPGRPVEELLESITCRRADGREIAFAEFSMAVQSSNIDTVRAEEIVLSVPDGRSVRTLVNCTPIQSEEGAVESVVITMQDLAPLDELERLRAEFLGMVSHELRAPLTAIKGSVDILLEAAPELDPAERHEYFRIIHDQAERMRGLIGDLLDAGRIDSGTLSVSPESSEVADLVDRARNTFLSGGGPHTVLIDLPLDLPPVMADRRRIVQVLNNLLSNAARCSPESSPIRVGAVRRGFHVAISVSDEGRGVPPELLPRLFQRGAGGAGSGGLRDKGGTGLGLVICKGLVEAHGGRIWAESDGAGQGAQFTFTVPVTEHVDAAGPAAVDPRRPPRSRAAQERARVLVVDDDPQTLRYVRDALTAAHYSPLVTGDHASLSHIIRTEQPQLVLLDLMLPGTDGIELMERVPELDDLPVVFISGYGRDETIARALEAGAADYIVKPFSATELTARVRAALRRHAEPEPFALGELAIHYEQRRVTVGEREVVLTATEYELLSTLARRAGRVVTYDALLRQIWGERDTGDVNLVRNFVKKLRAKLGDDAATPTWVLNVRGVGYRMPPPSAPLPQ